MHKQLCRICVVEYYNYVPGNNHSVNYYCDTTLSVRKSWAASPLMISIILDTRYSYQQWEISVTDDAQ